MPIAALMMRLRTRRAKKVRKTVAQTSGSAQRWRMITSGPTELVDRTNIGRRALISLRRPISAAVYAARPTVVNSDYTVRGAKEIAPPATFRRGYFRLAERAGGCCSGNREDSSRSSSVT